jgi:hypothetical protein
LRVARMSSYMARTSGLASLYSISEGMAMLVPPLDEDFLPNGARFRARRKGHE